MFPYFRKPPEKSREKSNLIPRETYKNSPGTAWFKGNVDLIWFVNSKTIEISLFNALNFP